MFYSNNYSKYIENLKLEKSKIAFRQLVENSQEDKSNDIVINDILSSKENNDISKEITIPEKDGNDFSYEEESISKDGIKIDVESNKTNSKFSKKIDNNVDSSNKSGKSINVDNEFSSSESNKVSEVDSFDSKDGKKVSEVNSESDKSARSVEFNDVNSEKVSNDLAYENTLSGKSERRLTNQDDPSIKEDTELLRQNETDKKEGLEIDRQKDPTAKEDTELLRQNETDKKEGKNVSDFDEIPSKSISDIIKSIKEEKKNEGQFADLRDVGKKVEVTNLNTQYQYFLIDPKDYENQTYEENARRFSYYPAGSYDQINANQIGAIQDAVQTTADIIVGDTSNILVSSVKVATDVVDMLNLVGPSANIYKTGITINNLRYDLKLDDKELDSQERRVPWRPYVNNGGSDADGNRDSDFFKEVDFAGKENQREDLKLDSEVSEPTSKKTNLRYVHEGLPKENGDLDTDFFEKADIIGKEENDFDYSKFTIDVSKIQPIKLFKYNQRGINITTPNIASILSYEENRWYDLPKSIGQIYVIPPDAELSDNVDDPSRNQAFSIPLQNNLQFEQMSRAATWNAINFFGRIGDVQQYSKTGNLEAITLTTKYFVDDIDYDIHRIQDIEMMYRSLVLPAADSAKYLYSSDNNKDSGKYYYFTRPPLVNIVLGNPDFNPESRNNFEESNVISNKTKPYHNLFTDIYTIPASNNSNEYNNSIFYKNFVVTNVNIDKNLNEYNYYVDKNGANNKNYYDTTGFTVTITILEIDENYLGSLPSFNNYEYTLKSRKSI